LTHERRILRYTDAVRSRLSTATAAIGITMPDDRGDAVALLRSVLDDGAQPADARAAAVILAASGRYPSLADLQATAGWLALGDTDQAWGHVCRLAAQAGRRSLGRRARPAPAIVVDLTRTSRATEMSGIPRVATALAREAAGRGAALVVWESGAPGEVSLGAGSRVEYPPTAWRKPGRLLRHALAAVKRLYWSTIGWMSRWSAGFHAARVLRSATAPLGDLLFGRAVPAELLVLGPGQYVCPEVNRPDVVDRILAWRRAQPGMRLSVVLHDLLPLETPRFFAPDQRLEHVEYVRLVAAADDVVVASPHLLPQVEAMRLLHGGGPQSARLVRYGLATAAWTARPTAPLGEPEFVMVGSMEARKNHVLALRALAALARDGQPTTLHVIGGGRPVDPQTRRVLAYARARGVTVLEHRGLDDDAMLGLLANARAALYLSWAEGFGLPVLEALSIGLPVFASDIPPHREHARYGGVVLVPPDRPDVLRDRLAEYLGDPAVEASLRAAIRTDLLPQGHGEWAREVLEPRGVERADG
jgi:glycosyltransferase involved in cell wall biosynthesis